MKALCMTHVFLLTLSNVLVQYPFDLLGFHSTWGALTYPMLFIVTDLTVRLSSAQQARNIIFLSMFPGLLLSYGVASGLDVAEAMRWQNLLAIHPMALRVALASFCAYLVGQLSDILVFQRVRKNSTWWLAPTLSATAGNLVDTLLFFSVAFYHSSNAFLSQHWTEIAIVDVMFKIAISLSALVPIYGVVLTRLSQKASLTLRPNAPSKTQSAPATSA